MTFRLLLDAREWFRDLRANKSFTTDFDSYYFCFMAGITTKRKKEATSSDTAELVDYFPDRYKNRGKILVSLFLSQELKSLGIDMSEKAIVHRSIAALIQPNSLSYLNDDGFKEFNKYSYGGFDVLTEWFDDRPRILHEFIRGFKQKTDDYLDH